MSSEGSAGRNGGYNGSISNAKPSNASVKATNAAQIADALLTAIQNKNVSLFQTIIAGLQDNAAPWLLGIQRFVAGAYSGKTLREVCEEECPDFVAIVDDLAFNCALSQQKPSAARSKGKSSSQPPRPTSSRFGITSLALDVAALQSGHSKPDPNAGAAKATGPNDPRSTGRTSR